jgi:hypothetical protein
MDAVHLLAITLAPLAVLISTAVVAALVALNVLWSERDDKVDLNALVPSNSGFTISDATAINDCGQMVGDATNTSGYEHAVLLTTK